MEVEKFIYCLEAVPDSDALVNTEVVSILEDMALNDDITSIYKACDTIDSLEESLNTLFYDDTNFKDYEIIYFVMSGQSNNIKLNNYYYSLEEIAEIFEGKLTDKIIHFSNKKILDLSTEESQYFLDVTGARAISGYGFTISEVSSTNTIDRIFFNMFQENDDFKDVVELMFKKHYKLCNLLDFRLYH